MFNCARCRRLISNSLRNPPKSRYCYKCGQLMENEQQSIEEGKLRSHDSFSNTFQYGYWNNDRYKDWRED